VQQELAPRAPLEQRAWQEYRVLRVQPVLAQTALQERQALLVLAQMELQAHLVLLEYKDQQA
jgi:hypothetical protein